MGKDCYYEVKVEEPTEACLDTEITIDIVGDIRCIYLHDHRIVGGKPYVSENLSTKSKKLTVREALEPFSEEELQASIRERQQRRGFWGGYRATRNELLKEGKEQ